MSTISTVVEMPEALHQAVQEFIANNPQWDQDRVNENAIALFLMQNGKGSNNAVDGMYLDSLFTPNGTKGE